MAGSAADLPAHRHDQFGIGSARVHRHVADALARQRQRLGVRVARERVVVELARVRLHTPIEHDFTVWFVGNQEDVVPVFDLLGAQDFSQSGQRFGGIDGSGRIVRRVDEHRRGSRVQRLFERFEVDLEVFGVGRHHGQMCAGSVDIRLVFREVGGKGDDFVARIGHHAQRVGQCAGRTRGREDVVGRIVHVEAAVEAFRNGRAHRGNAQRRRVSVQRDRFRLLVQGDHFVGEALRAGHARIAQRIVEHVLVADFGAARGRVFAQLADHGFSAEHGLVSFVDHGQPPRRSFISHVRVFPRNNPRENAAIPFLPLDCHSRLSMVTW